MTKFKYKILGKKRVVSSSWEVNKLLRTVPHWLPRMGFKKHAVHGSWLLASLKHRCVHLFPILYVLKMAMVRVYIPWKSAAPTNQAFSTREQVVKHLSACHYMCVSFWNENPVHLSDY